VKRSGGGSRAKVQHFLMSAREWSDGHPVSILMGPLAEKMRVSYWTRGEGRPGVHAEVLDGLDG
jgi:hypothetical protein